MSEYWKSTPKNWCKHCKIFVRDTKLETANHNASPKHQGNLKRFLRDLQRNHERDERDKERAKSEVARLNGIVSSTRSRTESSSVNGGPNQSYYSTSPAAPTTKVSESQRQQNLAKLAEMGISIPNELRPDMAMPGEWQVVSERIIDPAEVEQKSNGTSFGVHKRASEDVEDEEESFQNRKKNLRFSSKIPRIEGVDEGLDALLKDRIQLKTQTPIIEPDTEIKQEIKCNGTGSTEKLNDIVPIKNEPDESSNLIPTLLDEKNLEKPEAKNVVFKKRKVKNIRQK